MTTYDIHIQPLPAAEQGPIRGSFTYGFSKSIAVRGLQRLVNRWVIEFMTEEGSDPLDPARGTAFPKLIGSNVSASSDVRDICRISVEKANRRIVQYEAQYRPESDEDAFGSATIESLRVATRGTSVTLYVRLKNKAGKGAVIQVP